MSSLARDYASTSRHKAATAWSLAKAGKKAPAKKAPVKKAPAKKAPAKKAPKGKNPAGRKLGSKNPLSMASIRAAFKDHGIAQVSEEAIRLIQKAELEDINALIAAAAGHVKNLKKKRVMAAHVQYFI